MTNARIAIVGGGPAGCAAAHALQTAGLSVQLYEQASEIGGRTWTLRDGADRLDTGAGFITNFYPRVLALGRELGFSNKIRELHRVTGLHTGGELARLNISSLVSFARFPFLSAMDKLRMARWTAGLTFRRGRYDLARPETLAPLDTRSTAALADSELSPAIYHHLVRPGIEPFWYFACEDVSAALAEALTAHAAGARFYYVAGGIDQICQALVSGVAVSVGTTVTALSAVPGGVQVSATGPDGPSTETYGHAIVATTASVAHRLTADLPDEQVPPEQRAFLQSQAYASNIHLCYRMPRLPERLCMNAIFPCGPGQHPLAAVSLHRPKEEAPPAAHELVSIYLSDKESRRVMDWDDGMLAAHAWSLGRAVCPTLHDDVPPVMHIHRRLEAIPVHAVGRYQQAAAFQAAQLQPGRRVYFCGDYLATATIDGALATGQAAAAALTRT